MRHRKAGRKLKRTASHRKALLASLATSLLRHKRITTTVAKAKETRMFVEKIITRSKRALVTATTGESGTTAGRFIQSAGHARREVGKVIKDRAVLSELFATIAPKVATRPGGYTRIVRLGQRQGDGAELAVIELVDFQAGQDKAESEETAKDKKKAAPRKKAAGKEKASSKKKAAASEGAS
jgi:large subunit ribosomal protein L17